jgi:ElaB/YqjD/DUF883 family membrane-anchored ribosome-binding protein
MNSNVKDYTEPMKSQVSETMRNVKDKVGETAKNVSKTTDRYVRQNPWQTVAVATLAACVVGYLIGTLRD